MHRIIFALSVLLLASPASANKLSTKSIMDKAGDRTAFGFSTGDAKVTMILMSKDGKTRNRDLDAKAMKENQGKGDRRIIIRFKTPKTERGTSMLLRENKDRQTDMYLYLPAFKRTKRIVSGDKKNSFVGSDFSFGDMERMYMRQANYEQKSDKRVDGHDCYHVIAYPHDKETYSKMELFIRKGDFLNQRIRYYDRNGTYLKEYQIKKIAKGPDGPMVKQAVMHTKKTGHSTFFVINSLKDAKSLKSVEFKVEALPTSR